MKELVKIQSGLKVPKNQLNKFGGYKYRSCEDILNAVKPLLQENNCILTLVDEMVCLGEGVNQRFYVKATATLTNAEGQIVDSIAYAREELSKKGMDASQITGSASSYARKYALNGLFAIDDTKDADATNLHDEIRGARVLGEESWDNIVETCNFGKNKGQKWAEMTTESLEWYVKSYYEPKIGNGGDFEAQNKATLKYIKGLLEGRKQDV